MNQAYNQGSDSCIVRKIIFSLTSPIILIRSKSYAVEPFRPAISFPRSAWECRPDAPRLPRMTAGGGRSHAERGNEVKCVTHKEEKILLNEEKKMFIPIKKKVF
ncbi:MAG: hypothetical protein BWK80_47175 [Desulfobacteraceae bacterium IS3]|nr:MAG: hypothetical protein BWK80_47175 [Desulfobacteraceae bacterium IS3]